MHISKRILLIAIFILSLSSINTSAQSASDSNAGQIYKKTSPSVVTIERYGLNGKVAAVGSGFLISSDGRILTNYHVIAHSKQATVRLANGDAYDTVDVLDIDKRKDIALIKIRAVSLPFLTLGTSSAVEIGESIYSISNPLGAFENTLSQGIISGIRPTDGYRLLQVTAPISHGSSGSPIFNAKGEVVGIAVLTIAEGQSLNFAIPIDYAKGMLSSTALQSLASIYEPETTVMPKEDSAGSAVPPAMKENVPLFLRSKLGIWTQDDAAKVIGAPTRHRYGYNTKNPTVIENIIYAYSDPTQFAREIELSFDAKTSRLINIFMYPWHLNVDQVKQIFGKEYKINKLPDGRRFFMYSQKQVNVLIEADGSVTSIGYY